MLGVCVCVCVTTEKRHLDRLGQLGEFEQDSNTDSELESNTEGQCVASGTYWQGRRRGRFVKGSVGTRWRRLALRKQARSGEGRGQDEAPWVARRTVLLSRAHTAGTNALHSAPGDVQQRDSSGLFYA